MVTQWIEVLFYLAGAYVPLTCTGNIVVDGVLASCYASFDHDMAHFAITPMQWFPDIIEWIFGGHNAMHTYVSIVKSVGRYVIPNNYLHVRLDIERK